LSRVITKAEVSLYISRCFWYNTGHMKIKDLARIVEGTVEGDGDIDITGMDGIDTAEPGDLTFAVDENKLSDAEKSRASCVLTVISSRKSTKPLIRVSNPKLSFLITYNALNAAKEVKTFTHPSANVSEKAIIGKNVHIDAGVYIEDGVKIGDNVTIEANSVIKKNCEIGSFCHIYPNVTLYKNVKLGKNVVLHGGVVLGSDGFGYVKDKGKIYKFPQLGRVIIEDDVEIGSNTTIDRGSLSNTVIGAGSKIDNLCQIAHNVKIGKNALIAAFCGIAGSVTIGSDVTIGGQVGIGDNIKIGDNVTIGAQSGVTSNIKSGAIILGFPARPITQTKRQMAVLSWLEKNYKLVSAKIKE